MIAFAGGGSLECNDAQNRRRDGRRGDILMGKLRHGTGAGGKESGVDASWRLCRLVERLRGLWQRRSSINGARGVMTAKRGRRTNGAGSGGNR
jgi:hypothetical protein